MHPLNKLRLNAGITIDPKLEMVTEKKAKMDYDKDGKIESEKEEVHGSRRRAAKLAGTMNEKEGSAFPGCENEEAGKTKYTKGKKFPGLEKCPSGRSNKECKDVMEDHFPDGTHLTDPEGKCWEVTGNTGEGDDEVYHLKCPETGKTVKKKYTAIKDWKKGKKETVKEMMGGYEMEEEPDRFKTGDDFRQGQRVMYDNGIWIVYVQDAKADMIGVIPPSMKGASKEEKDKAVQMVKPDKLRIMSQEEEEAVGARSRHTIEDVDPMTAAAVIGAASGAGSRLVSDYLAKRRAKRKATKEQEGKKKSVKESMHNYHDNAYPETHADHESNPVNAVPQGDDGFKMDPKGELPSQMDVRGDQSMDDYVNEVKVPAKITQALKEAIKSLRDEVNILGMGHTAQENKVFHENAAAAFEQLLELLEDGSVQSVKRAQLHAMTLMGPMLHKLPESVWNFLTTGGPRRSLKDYMTDVSKKYPIEGPRNTLD